MFYFIGKCLMLDESPGIEDGIVEEIGKSHFSWEQFVWMGSHHLVLPALYVKFSKANLLSYLPDELTPYLAEIFNQNLERNKQLLSQIIWIIQLFENTSIRLIFLKGAGAMLDGLYNNPGERMMVDIDCLVGVNDFQDTIHLLKNEGYSSQEFKPEDLPMMHHYPSLFKPNEPAPIDVHKYPIGKRYLKYLNIRATGFQGSESAEYSGADVLSAQDQLMLNFMHSQLQDKGQYYANVSLRNLYEFYRLSLQQDPSEVLSQMGPLTGKFNNYMALAAKLFDPIPLFHYKNNFRARGYIARLERNKSSRFWYHLSKAGRAIISQFYYYLSVSVKAIYIKTYRDYLMVRLIEASWYKRHFFTVRNRILK